MRVNPTTIQRFIATCTFAVTVLLVAAPTQAQLEFEREPIDYHNQPAQDPIAHLRQKLDAGEIKLDYASDRGYLPALLKLLNVPESSQMLVFSKTSFQLQRISPHRPRALYFNDNIYVGWVQNGEVVELSAVDPKLGAVFYTLSQEQAERPAIVRDKGQCLICHASSRTEGVPGYLVRSVFADAGGQPKLGSGTFNTDHCSPLAERWGGWYVTGTHGTMRHMGNVIATDLQRPENIDRDAGANLTGISKRVDVSPYLRPTSDIVALMVLEHQTQMHNLITLAGYESQMAAHYDRVMNEALKQSPDHRSESTGRRIAAAGDKLLKYLLFTEEFELTSPVAGVSPFTRDFTALGPKDHNGRSLREFDLKTRLFKYPCSYLIYSPSFDALPSPVKRYVLRRLREILTRRDQSPEFARLTATNRKAILEILRETKPGLLDNDSSEQKLSLDAK